MQAAATSSSVLNTSGITSMLFTEGAVHRACCSQSMLFTECSLSMLFTEHAVWVFTECGCSQSVLFTECSLSMLFIEHAAWVFTECGCSQSVLFTSVGEQRVGAHLVHQLDRQRHCTLLMQQCAELCTVLLCLRVATGECLHQTE